ncbi:hydroxylamine reductase [Peptoniphilus equinus]|uniref:Hydroxylamine reductase n=1 Tax=Peptoniphilus equinus TaxID=3016343 RepID=A0ABY7QWK9_9FIRM|nr:hydroxylamine reductase [Peptoniphilus equinus]WBW50761.1 hydroxylamine reductase [Peptoniphilus equinus]
MFCYQCQETAGNKGCTQVGVCGKNATVANLQDMLIWVTKGLAQVLVTLRAQGRRSDQTVNRQVTYNLFTTITNANFDNAAFQKNIVKTLELKAELLKDIKDMSELSEAALYDERELTLIYDKAVTVGVFDTEDEDIRSLRELTIYGLKGLGAYMQHANALLKEDEDIHRFIQETLVKTLEVHTPDEWVDLVLETGSYGVRAMALLDEANTSAYGHPQITQVTIGTRHNPAILISGHDLRDMEMLLKQTEGTGVDVYTHSEMLPANYYPAFKKYPHFVGNYGNAWWRQREEIESFNGPVLFTTNCIVPPKASYIDRIYTTGAAGYPGCKHLGGEIGEEKDFSEIIAHAKRLAAPTAIESGHIVGGFAHGQVFELADSIVEAVKSGAIRKFVVMAGCDGRQQGRNYYTMFAEALPKDTVILTAGCAKYRYNKLDLGDINGIPRVLDAGQCNDAYSLALIALKLKDILELNDINDLPIIYNIAWYEQKAVIVLLALLSLGIKHIHLGPTLPAFLSPNVVKVLEDNFDLASIETVEADMAAFFPEITKTRAASMIDINSSFTNR